MRSFILTCFLVLCLCAAASAETKIGFVDMQAVIAKGLNFKLFEFSEIVGQYFEVSTIPQIHKILKY